MHGGFQFALQGMCHVNICECLFIKINFNNSRVLLRKHFILDVLGGIAIALVEGIVISYFWIEETTARNIFNWVSDEKTVGSYAEVL